MKNKKRLIGFVSSLMLIAPLFSCGQQAHTHVYVPHAEVPSNCCETGTEFYYTCEGCKDYFNAEKVKIDAPVVIPKDPQTHKGTKFLRASQYKNEYKVDDTFDLTNATLLWACEHCDGVPLNQTERSMVTVTYPTKDATCFTTNDVKESSVNVTLKLNNYTCVATVKVGKKDNTITGLADMEKHCGFEITEFDLMFIEGKISASSGEAVDLFFADTIDGTYVSRDDLSDDKVFNVRSGEESSVYYVKASSKATDAYVKAEAGPVKLTITHNELTWDTSRSDYDFVGCLCDEANIKKFNKTPTNNTQILLTAETATLDLTGTDYGVNPYTEMTIESVSIDNAEGAAIDLGKSLTIPTAPIANAGIYGEAKVKVVVSHAQISDKIPAGTHTIEVPVTICTATINNGNEWTSLLVPKATDTTITGYYVLTADFTVTAQPPAWISGWDKAIFSGTIDGNDHKVTLGQGTYGQFYFLKNATIKNMTLINNWWRRTEINYYLLSNKANTCTFEDLTFKISGYNANQLDTPFSPCDNYGYLFGNGGVQACSFDDCLFDFEQFKIPCLLSHSANNTASNTFAASVLKCKEITELYTTNLGETITEAEGLDIQLNKEELLEIDPVKKYVSTGSDPIALVLPEEYKDLLVSKITVKVGADDENLGTNLSQVVIPNGILTDTAQHGDKHIFVHGTIGSSKYKLGVPVRIITQSITTIEEFSSLTHISGTKKTVYGYYELANDISFNVNTYVELTSSTYNVFSGTFDGNGYTITSKSRSNGLFGELNGALVKNVKITDGWSYGGIDSAQSILSLDMINTKVEDVTIQMTAKANRNLIAQADFPLSKQSYGWINSRVCQDSSFKNCVFDGGTTLKVQTLLGTHPSCVRDTFVNCTFNCESYYCLFQSSYSQIVTTTAEGLTISGTCVYVA